MKIQDIKDKVESIRKMAVREIKTPSDGDILYSEYNLWKEVLEVIAYSNTDSSKFAQEALKTLEINFDRFFS